MHKSFVRNFRGGYDDEFDGDANYMDADGGFDEDNFFWDSQIGPPVPFNRNNNSRRPRYGDAYEDYRGGYGPGGGYGPRPIVPGMPPRMLPPPLMPPMGQFGPPGPPRLLRPPGPPRPMWGQGFGPRGPPRRNIQDERAIKYLMRCGVTKENLKNLPHDLLMLIQPEHCGLCDYSCDSFATSRMHYISKNHLKNQKKWLNKTQGFKQTAEIPFKSRDLYCELCDIQITSKMHGDAHYDGKPHRGIVEGRKKPKNPLLLQSNMQQRLEQLIRREKRCLKPVKGTTADGEEGAEATTSEPKITSPDLYCNICKTTVTCSEQMMMHMNGKKHLSKEKQHILNMMSGKANKNGNEEAENEEDEDENDEVGDGEAQAEGEDENKGNGEGDHADDDWGNEAWENQDQAQTAAQA